MRMIYSIYLLFGLIASSLCQPSGESALDYVTQECSHKLNKISTIKEFRNFMIQYKIFIDEVTIIPSDKYLKNCYLLKDALFELERLVVKRGKEVCSMNHIEQLIDFHYKYLTDGKLDSKTDTIDRLPTNSSYIAYFFSLYAHQIAFTCKSRISERLQEAQKKEECSTVLSAFLPLGGKGLPQETKELSQVFKKVESFAPVLRSRSPQVFKPYIDVLVSDEVIVRLEKLKSICKARRPYYNAILSPVAALAQVGYSISNIPDDLNGDESQVNLECWIISSQLCEGILTTHFTPKTDLQVDPELKSKFVSVKWGILPDENDPVAPIVEYHDTVDEISPFITSIVKKRFTKMGKMKQKVINWTRKLIERHVNIDALRRESNEGLVQTLTEESNGIDSKVAFNGKQFDTKRFNPASVVLNEADTVVQLSSSFWNKLGLLFSSVVAVVMSAVFIYFSIVAIATAIQQSANPGPEGSIKTEWNQLRDKKVKNVEERFNKLTYRIFHVHKPN